MKHLPLSQGKFAIVDDADYEWLNQWKWTYRSNGYAVAAMAPFKIGQSQSGRIQRLHRFIIGAPKGAVVDHVNGDTLDNRRSNIRLCTVQENARNMRSHRDSSSAWKGISWHKGRKQWLARITLKPSNQVFLGWFDKESEAARAYNAAAGRYFGEFAKLNEVPA